MLVASDRDLEALRVGIREEARREEAQQRKYIHPPRHVYQVQAGALVVGDILVGTDSGYSFYEAGVVTYKDELTRDDFWVEVRDGKGGYGRAFGRTDVVLVVH